MLNNIRPLVKPMVDTAAKPLSFINPNILTALGVLPSILIFIFIITNNYLVAGLLFLTTPLDMLDGAVARLTGKSSRFGEFWDATVDRVSDSFIISSFGFAGVVAWEIIVPLLAASLLTSYTRARAEAAAKGEIKLQIGLIERPERIIIIALSTFAFHFYQENIWREFNLLELIFGLLAVASVITVLQRIYLAYKLLGAKL